MSEWMPIETAPIGSRDDISTYFIGARLDILDGNKTLTATCYKTPNGVYEWWGGGMRPTHWMPLPRL